MFKTFITRAAQAKYSRNVYYSICLFCLFSFFLDLLLSFRHTQFLSLLPLPLPFPNTLESFLIRTNESLILAFIFTRATLLPSFQLTASSVIKAYLKEHNYFPFFLPEKSGHTSLRWPDPFKLFGNVVNQLN